MKTIIKLIKIENYVKLNGIENLADSCHSQNKLLLTKLFFILGLRRSGVRFKRKMKDGKILIQ